MLADEADHGVEVEALEAHLTRLRRDQDALARRIAAVEHTLVMRRAGRQPRVDMVLEGFNDRYEDEVAQRWGREVFEQSNRWWHAKSIDQQRQFQADAEGLLARWGELYDRLRRRRSRRVRRPGTAPLHRRALPEVSLGERGARPESLHMSHANAAPPPARRSSRRRGRLAGR